MPEIFRETWAIVLAWFGFIASCSLAIRNAYAAERDRRALSLSELEREKLSLEVARLKNDPALVADRRQIYDRLRTVVAEITAHAQVTVDQIRVLHGICHDATFRFPAEIPEKVQAFITQASIFFATNFEADGKRNRAPREEWHQLTEKNFAALEEIRKFEEALVDTFKPYLSL